MESNYVDAIATLSDWFRNLMSIFTRKASTFAPVQKGLRLATRLSDLGFTSWTATDHLILRMQFVCNSATSLRRKTNPSYFSLVSLQFHLKQEEKRIKQLNESKKLKDFQKTQIVSTDFDRYFELFFCERWFFHPRIRSLGICE